jgi:hypothetical protein
MCYGGDVVCTLAAFATGANLMRPLADALRLIGTRCVLNRTGSGAPPSFKRAISHNINVLEPYAFEAASPVNPLLHDLNIFFVQFYADTVSPQHPAR